METVDRKRNRLYQLNSEAAEYYAYQLRGKFGAAGREYLQRRELTKETIRRFGLGYAPDSFNRLYNYLKKKGYFDEELRESGLVRFNTKGTACDFFRNRVIYPILDRDDLVIGFGARSLGEGGPKYINLQETAVFDKGSTLFGINLARKTRQPYLLLCEGYMDVIMLQQTGFDSAVATLGTALTKRHALQLRQYTDRIVICYDNDGAGKNAAMRAIPLLREAGLDIRVIDLKPYKDPDEFVRNEGTDAFENRLEQTLDSFLFRSDVWKSGYRLDDPADLTAFYKRLARELLNLKDAKEQYNNLTAVCERYSISRELLLDEMERINLGQTASKRQIYI